MQLLTATLSKEIIIVLIIITTTVCLPSGAVELEVATLPFYLVIPILVCLTD